MRRWLREPLVHFFCVGALLFGAYSGLHLGSTSRPNEIVVSRGQLQSLRLQFERVWQRPATQQELQGLVDNWVKEEIFYREGIAMGLDRDDPVVRRRIGQKLEFILDSATPPAPTDAELQAWLDAHPHDYRIEPTYSLRQVYFDPARHGDRLDAHIAAARRALASGKAFTADTTMLPMIMEGATASEVARVFGNEFSERLKAMSFGGWQGPVPSSFGLHLVELTGHDAGRAAALADVRDRVERDLSRARAEQTNAAFYNRLRSSYAVRIEADDVPIADPVG
jgi:parvulin-like peptidyl-prolyl cis-trans isomerase-like protein